MSDDLPVRLRIAYEDESWTFAPSRDVLGGALGQARRTRVRRRIQLGAALATTTLVVGTAATLTWHERGDDAPTAPPVSTAISTAVVHPGELLRGQGTVVIAPGKAPVFCAAVTIFQSLPADVECGSPRVRLSSVDASRLVRLSGAPGTTAGSADITGVWNNGVLTVRTQRKWKPANTSGEDFSFRDPPCPTPAGGWHGEPGNVSDMGGVEYFKAKHLADVLEVEMWHPAGGAIVSLTVGVPATAAAAHAALDAKYPNRLCIVLSRWSPSTINATRQQLHRLGKADPGNSLIQDEGPDPHGQPQLALQGDVRDAAVDAALRSTPPGLVTFRPWLTPAG